MDSTYLLVIDHSPDLAQTINSFLRNAGMAVRVANASTMKEFEQVLVDHSPSLVLVGTQLPAQLRIGQVLHTADKHSTPVVFQFSPDSKELINAALVTHSVELISGDDNTQLMHVVQQHISGVKSIRARDDLQQKLDELQHRYDLLLDSARDSIAYIHEGFHIYANRAYLELLQVRAMDEIEGLSLLELMQARDDSDLKKLLRDMNQGVFSKKALAVIINSPADKQIRAELTFSPARFNGEQCIQMMVRKQDANLVLQEELAHLRQTDQLTQMNNRHTFTEKLSVFINEQTHADSRNAVLYIEPDGIMELQQELGLEGIDAYTLDLANIINACMDEGDITGRFSNHGFVALVSRDNKSEILKTANCILDSYSNHIIDLGEQTMSAACSIGVATLGSLTQEAEEIITQSRKAFKQASKKGNGLANYKPELTPVDTGESERDWVERIRFALNNHHFYTVQQSIVDLEGENEGLFENTTFIREEQGDTAASEFMPDADRHDLGGVIDRHVIPQLLTAIAGSGDRHIVSLSTGSVLDFSFPTWFKRQLQETEVVGSQLILQISAIMAESNLKPTRRLIDELRSLGCGVVLSEFDNDRRTLQLLDYLPVNMIKLRPGLARGLSDNRASQDIIRSVVKGIEAHDITIIADEVDDASDLAVLWQCGVKLVTGDFLNEAPQVVGQ